MTVFDCWLGWVVSAGELEGFLLRRLTLFDFPDRALHVAAQPSPIATKSFGGGFSWCRLAALGHRKSAHLRNAMHETVGYATGCCTDGLGHKSLPEMELFVANHSIKA